VRKLQERGLIKPAEARPVETKAVPLSGSKDARRTLEPVPLNLGALQGSVLVRGGIQTAWVEINPDLATRWLRNNVGNRKLKPHAVTGLARDMSNGDFVPTHQGIAFNDAEQLIDGQHKLTAIVESGVTLPMLVTWGLPRQIEGKKFTVMDVVDSGSVRKVGDQLAIQHKLKDGHRIAMICGALAGLCDAGAVRRLNVGHTLEIYHAFELSVKWVIFNRSRDHGLRLAGVLAGFAFAHAVAPEMARVFHAFNKGEFAPGTPLGQLHAVLTSPESRLLMRSMDRDLARLVCQVLWLDRRGTKVEKLVPGEDGVKFYRAQQAERCAAIAKIFQVKKVA
jgi:hypothetical protein